MFSSAFEAFATIQCIMIIAALGHYLPLSMRQLDVGIAAYMSIGAYVSAIMTREFGFTFPAALAGGAVVAGAGALFIDALATRVKLTGFSYAIFSLSFAESLRIILENNDYVGGVLGFSGIAHHTTFGVAAGVLAVVIVLFWLLDRSRLGQLRTAIADDEFIVPQFGVPLVTTKLIIFALGGALGGLAGGLYAHYVLYIRPADFGFVMLIALQLPVVFGGLDRFYGAIVGTALLAWIPEVTRDLGGFRLMFAAAATLLMLIWRPTGLLTHDTIAAISAAFRRLLTSLRGGSREQERPEVQ